jgi:hypothetical protein
MAAKKNFRKRRRKRRLIKISENDGGENGGRENSGG